MNTVASLLALDIALGPTLEMAIRDCVDRRQPFCVLDQRISSRRQRDHLQWLGATHITDGHSTTTLEGGQPVDEEVGLVMLTSGSSGQAKAAEHTWDSLTASAQMTQATLRKGVPPVWLPCLPVNHIGGLAVLLRTILDDASLVWADDVEQGPDRGATHIAVVRSQLARHNFSRYQCVLVGGGRAPQDRPANVITTWGMTETGSGVVYDGRPLPGVEITTINGEICVNSPTLFRSYRNAPRPEVVDESGERWFPTGDGGTFVDGKLSVFGRLQYVITTGGEKVWPEDLESVLQTVPGVRDVAVTGVEDVQWGERIVALVVSDRPDLDEELRSVAEERIGPWAKPKEIRYVVALPRTDNGKLQRHALTNLF